MTTEKMTIVDEESDIVDEEDELIHPFERVEDAPSGENFVTELKLALGEIGWGSIVCAAVVAVVATAYALIFHPSYRKPSKMHHRQRSVPTFEEQRLWRERWSFAVSEIYPTPRNRTNVTTFAHGHVTSKHRLPRFFYESASFGVIVNTSSDTFSDFLHILQANAPLPADIWPWRATFPHSGSDDDFADGLFLRYDLTGLREHRGNQSLSAQQRAVQNLQQTHAGLADLSDWHLAQANVERAARFLDEPLILSWTPHHFGDPHEDDDLRHVHILQTILPVRSGYQHLRTSVVCWSCQRAV